jgi:glucose-1-phosphate thymidylyltransferase
VDTWRALGRLHGPGLAGFRRSTLLAGGNISADRIRSYAHLAVAGDGTLTRILEKPTEAEAAAFGPDPLVSMNAWRFSPDIFDSCRLVTPSARGELEIQDAVRHAMDYQEEPFKVVEVAEGVLDLSERGDIPAVAVRLAAIEPRP